MLARCPTLLCFAPCLARISPLFCFNLWFRVSHLFNELTTRDTRPSHRLGGSRQARAGSAQRARWDRYATARVASRGWTLRTAAFRIQSASACLTRRDRRLRMEVEGPRQGGIGGLPGGPDQNRGEKSRSPVAAADSNALSSRRKICRVHPVSFCVVDIPFKNLARPHEVQAAWPMKPSLAPCSEYL